MKGSIRAENIWNTQKEIHVDLSYKQIILSFHRIESSEITNRIVKFCL